MRVKDYWSFKERHPRQHGRLPHGYRMNRLVDRLDDAIVVCLSQIEYLRIKRTAWI